MSEKLPHKQRTLQLLTRSPQEPLLVGFVQQKDYLVTRTMKIQKNDSGRLDISISGERIMIQDMILLQEFSFLYGDENSTSTLVCTNKDLQLEISELRSDIRTFDNNQIQTLISNLYDELNLSFMEVQEDKVKRFNNFNIYQTCQRYKDTTQVTQKLKNLDSDPLQAPDIFLIPESTVSTPNII